MHHGVITLCFITFVISSLQASRIYTVINRDEFGDSFNTTVDCSFYDAKEDTIPDTCLCLVFHINMCQVLCLLFMTPKKTQYLTHVYVKNQT